jgi:glycosyltransferase involved in cell wall biosynthesis
MGSAAVTARETMKLVIQNMSHVWGGNEKWLSIVATGLGARGHDVVVSCPSGAVRTRLDDLGLRTTGFRPRGVIDPVSGISFALWLRAERPDAVLLTSWHSVAWATLAARMAGARKVVLRQGIVREFPRHGARAVALRRGIDDVIVNSTEIRDAWQRSAPGETRGKVHVVLNAISSRRSERQELREKLRGELGAPDEALLIGAAGHLFKRKGFDLLLRAFANAAVKNSRLAIVGDGDYRKELAHLGNSLGISDRTHWLGQRPDGPDIIAALDAFVLSSHNEGMANVMLEAMAGGTPVIAFGVSGVRQAIGATPDRPAGGWIVPAGDEAGLSKAIRDVCDDIRTGSAAIRARADEAHWRIENWFGADRMLDECEAILFGP